MRIVKGFIEYTNLIDNDIEVISKFGELSERSNSYAKDKLRYYSATISDNTRFISFTHTLNDVPTPLPTSVYEGILKVGSWLYERASTGQVPNDPVVVRQNLNAQFSAFASDFVIGILVTEGTFRLPEFLTYEDTSTSEPTTIRLWFTDAAFSVQYEDFHIEVTSPIVPYDDFWLDPIIVKQKLANYDLEKKTDEVQASSQGYPYTQIKTFRFDYHNPADDADRTPTYWIVIIYGQAGINPDIIRETIAQEVLDNSVHDRDEWATILPDLFKSTEFIFTPFWHIYSVPNHQFQAGMHSPTIDPRKVLPWVKRTARGVGYNDLYVTNRYELTSNIYKSIGMGVVGGPENRDGITQLSNKWPEYILVTNDSPDFNRMSVATQDFSNILSELLVAAEKLGKYTAPPLGVYKVVRDGVIYASKYYDRINYLVVSKESAEELFI